MLSLSFFDNFFYVSLLFWFDIDSKENSSIKWKKIIIQCLFFFLLQYFVFVFLIFVVMLVGAILGFVFREKVVQTMRQEMYSSLPLYGNRRDVTLAWDETQTRLKCCGVESYRDWYGSIPQSCCQETYGGQRMYSFEFIAQNDLRVFFANESFLLFYYNSQVNHASMHHRHWHFTWMDAEMWPLNSFVNMLR